MHHGLLLALSLWVIGVSAFAARASAQTSESAWDGLDRLIELAASAEVSLHAPNSLDLGQLAPSDALLIVSPHRGLPVGALTAFLREGGRVALLDEGGGGDRLLSAYQVTRSPLTADVEAPALRGDAFMRIAYPASEHPLVTGVSLLLTNHASELHHPELRPVFTFGRSGRALLLAGAVGAGRLVAAGDGSLLINQHMAAPSHRRFAVNLLAYLTRPSGKLWLVGPETSFRGSYGGVPLPLSRLDGWLKRLARPDFPPAVLWLLSLALCGIAVVVAGGALPRRSPYVRPELFPEPDIYAGFAGRIAAVERAGLNLVWPLLDYRRELEGELGRLLGLDGAFERGRAVRLARTRGLSASDARELDTLLEDLDTLASEASADDGKRRIQPEELRNMVRKGEELLRKLGSDDTT
jgi:hypothetical protein